MKSFHLARLWLEDFLSVFVMVGAPTVRRAAAAGVQATRRMVQLKWCSPDMVQNVLKV